MNDSPSDSDSESHELDTNNIVQPSYIQDLHIDRGVKDVDAIEEFYTQNANGTNNLFKANIIGLLCSLSCVQKNLNKTMRTTERYEIVKDNWDAVMKNWCGKSDANRLLSIIGESKVDGIRNFPDYVVKYAENFIKSIKGEDKKDKGSAIWLKFDECRTYITNYINPLWKDPEELESGQNETGLIHSMLERLWPVDATRKAKSALSSEKNRRRKSGTEEDLKWIEDIEKDKHMCQVWIDRKVECNSFKPNWRPNCWLTFLVMGKPGKIYGRLYDHFISGNESKSNDRASTSRIVQQARKRGQEDMARSSEKDLSYKKIKDDIQLNVKLEKVINHSKTQQLEKYLNVLQMRIKYNQHNSALVQQLEYEINETLISLQNELKNDINPPITTINPSSTTNASSITDSSTSNNARRALIDMTTPSNQTSLTNLPTQIDTQPDRLSCYIIGCNNEGFTSCYNCNKTFCEEHYTSDGNNDLCYDCNIIAL